MEPGDSRTVLVVEPIQGRFWRLRRALRRAAPHWSCVHVTGEVAGWLWLRGAAQPPAAIILSLEYHNPGSAELFYERLVEAGLGQVPCVVVGEYLPAILRLRLRPRAITLARPISDAGYRNLARVVARYLAAGTGCFRRRDGGPGQVSAFSRRVCQEWESQRGRGGVG